MVLYRPTLYHVQHRWSYCCPIKFSLQLKRYFRSHRTPEALLHFNHPPCIRWFTSPSISVLFCTIDPHYKNYVTCGMIWSLTFTSTLETLHLLLKLHFIYVLLLLKQNSYVSKAHLHVSNLPFNSSFDSPCKTISSAKCLQLCALSWIILVHPKIRLSVKLWCNLIVIGKSLICTPYVLTLVETPLIHIIDDSNIGHPNIFLL